MTNCALKVFIIMTSMIAYDNHLKESFDYDELFNKYSGFIITLRTIAHSS